MKSRDNQIGSLYNIDINHLMYTNVLIVYSTCSIFLLMQQEVFSDHHQRRLFCFVLWILLLVVFDFNNLNISYIWVIISYVEWVRVGYCFDFVTMKISRIVENSYIICFQMKYINVSVDLDNSFKINTGEFKGGAWGRAVDIHIHPWAWQACPCMHACVCIEVWFSGNRHL